MKKLTKIVLGIIVVLIVLVMYGFYQFVNFIPDCPDFPYRFQGSLNKNITNNEEAKSVMIEYLTKRNPDINLSRIDLESVYSNENLSKDKNISEGIVWVFEGIDLALDKEGNVYYLPGCY